MKRFVKIIKGFWQGSWVCLFLYNTWPNNPDDEVPNRFVFSKWIQGKTEVIFKNLQTHEFLPGDYKHIAKTFLYELFKANYGVTSMGWTIHARANGV